MRSEQFIIGETAYKADRLDARSQYLLLRRLMPLLPALDGLGRSMKSRADDGLAGAFATIAPLATAPEADLDFILDACMVACVRREGDLWISLANEAGSLDLALSLQIVAHVVALNFGPFFAVEGLSPDSLSWESTGFEPLTMPNGTDWLYRPALRRLCTYRELIDGTLGIEDVAEMNTLLDVSDENERRARAAAEEKP